MRCGIGSVGSWSCVTTTASSPAAPRTPAAATATTSNPHNQGGVTCPCNLAPLCRAHHRAKTHHGWTYQTLTPALYLWHAPPGHRYLVTPAGTHPLDTHALDTHALDNHPGPPDE